MGENKNAEKSESKDKKKQSDETKDKSFNFTKEDAFISTDNIDVFISVNPKAVEKLNKTLTVKDMSETAADIKRVVSRYEAIIKH